jgi:type IV pilus assembly protein PilX
MRLSPRPRSTQRGFVLVSAILLLVVVTILAIGMFRSFGLDEKIAGNTREKQRAFQAAVSAQQYAEQWLATGSGGAAITCTGMVTASMTTGQICVNTLPTVVGSIANIASALPWKNGAAAVGVTYAPTAMNIQQTNYAAGSYYKYPVFYISFLGVGTAPTGGQGNLYQIDAVGYGGTASTAAVVESTYIVQIVASPLDNP